VTAFYGAEDIVPRFRFKPRKKLGQHFLVDEAVLGVILSAADLVPSDVVIEVGSGWGVLTKELAGRVSSVIAVEIDARLARGLGKELSSSGNVEVVRGDILGISPPELLHGREAGSRGYKVIANLPYYITSPVLRHFLESELKPASMVVMVQREVGEAIADSDRNSLLSLRVRFYSKPTIVARVPAKSFYPVPKVDSLVLRLDVYPEPPLEISDVASFFNTIISGFSAPRKQLRNSLAHSLGLPPGEVAELLQKAGVAPCRRAESLSLEEWRSLWETLVPSSLSWLAN